MKKIRMVAIALCALMAITVVASGCEVNPERDAAQVVATVNGIKITKQEVYDSMGIEIGTDLESWGYTAEEVQQYKQEALTNLIYSEVVRQKAEESGYLTYTDEQRQQAEATVNGYFQDVYDEALAQANTDGEADPEAVATKAVDDYIAMYGYTRQELIDSELESGAMSRLRDDTIGPIDATEDEIQTSYQSQIAELQTAYAEDPEQPINDAGAGALLYLPTNGYFEVRHILVALPDEDQSAISDARTAGNEEEANNLRAEALKGIEARAKEALAKLDAGTDFETVLTEYNDDPGMEDPATTYLVYDGSTSYVEGFASGAAQVKQGEYTGLVATDFGYHIIKRLKDYPQGAVPLESVHDQVRETVVEEKKNEAWVAQADEWYKAAKVKTYPKRLG